MCSKIAHILTNQYYFMNGKYKHIAEKDSETMLKEERIKTVKVDQ